MIDDDSDRAVSPRAERSSRRRCRGDNGSMMPMALVMVAFLIVSFAALVSASEAWGERRDAQATAAAAARAAAQPGAEEIVGGRVQLDAGAAAGRAQSILSSSGHTGSVSVSGNTVTVTATGTVEYSFGGPGFQSSMTATVSADAENSVFGG
jgi:hypothetical protein